MFYIKYEFVTFGDEVLVNNCQAWWDSFTRNKLDPLLPALDESVGMKIMIHKVHNRYQAGQDFAIHWQCTRSGGEHRLSPNEPLQADVQELFQPAPFTPQALELQFSSVLKGRSSESIAVAEGQRQWQALSTSSDIVWKLRQPRRPVSVSCAVQKPQANGLAGVLLWLS